MNDPIDIKDLSLGQVISSFKRLKLGSLIWLVSSIFVLGVAIFSAGVSSNIGKAKAPVFTQHWTSQDLLDSC
jgi:hypothetical protein